MLQEQNQVWNIVLLAISVIKGNDGQVLECDTDVSKYLCPSTVITCTCTVNGTSSSTRWWFSTLNPCPGSYNMITLTQPFPCAPPAHHSSDECGQYISASNNYASNGPCRVSTLRIIANPALNGLQFDCRDYATSIQGISSGSKTIKIIAPPSTPAFTSLTFKSDELTAKWTSLPMATNYNISINDGRNTSVFQPANISSIATFTGLTMNTSYNISVVAYNCAGMSQTVSIIVNSNFTGVETSQLCDSLVVVTSVSASSAVSLLVGLLLASVIRYAAIKKLRPQVVVALYDEVDPKVKPDRLEISNNFAYEYAMQTQQAL